MLDVLSEYLVPVLVTLTAGSTTATAAIAWSMFVQLKRHDRAIFGSDEIEHHVGLLQIAEQTQGEFSTLADRVERLEATRVPAESFDD